MKVWTLVLTRVGLYHIYIIQLVLWFSTNTASDLLSNSLHYISVSDLCLVIYKIDFINAEGTKLSRDFVLESASCQWTESVDDAHRKYFQQ